MSFASTVQSVLDRIGALERRIPATGVPLLAWATVDSVSPLRVRLDDGAVLDVPTSCLMIGGVAVGARVRVEMYGTAGRRVVVTGVLSEKVAGEDGRRIVIGSLGAGSEVEPSLVLRRRYLSQDREARLYLSAALAEVMGEVGIQVSAGGSPTSRFYINGLGQLMMQTYAGSPTPTAARPVPFAMAAGMVSIAGGSGATTSAPVVFPTDRFTTVPVITMTPHTGAPEAISGWGHSGQTKDGFTAYMRRSNAVATNFHWTAVQMTPTSAAG